jgi:peptide/nickel transport system permease protein
MVEALNAPFIQAARGHGITQWRLLLRHALPAAANPLITLFGISVATLLSGSLLVEVISGWPGIGPLFLTAIYDRDFFLVIGVVLLSSLFLVSGNFIADMLLYASDPRIRAEAK